MPTDVERVADFAQAITRVRGELSKVIVGQQKVVDELLIAVLAGGHCLVQGVPGLAKTLLVQTLARTMDLTFRRIQFTPDLMPSDITGTDILQEDPESRRRSFEFVKGPIFANVVLADEINRAPPKTQAALLQAMQENEVTTSGRTLPLPSPFFVLATQNPIEQEGTYPLPEAQLDRFMFMTLVNYPAREEELDILKRTTGEPAADVSPVLTSTDLAEMQSLVRRVPIGGHVYAFALDITRATRPGEPGASDFIRHWLSWGAGPRAGQAIVLAAKARALLESRIHVTTEDVLAVAPAALRHRIIPNFNAEAEGVNAGEIIERVLALVPRPGRDRML